MATENITSLSVFLAVSTDGFLSWQYLEGNNNRWTMASVINSLVKVLDVQIPNWRNTHVIVHDNCPSFVTAECKSLLNYLNVPYMLTAPASFQALVVEGCF